MKMMKRRKSILFKHHGKRIRKARRKREEKQRKAEEKLKAKLEKATSKLTAEERKLLKRHSKKW